MTIRLGLVPMPILKQLQETEGFQLRTFAVPPPGVEMGAQILDITQRYRADFVIMHVFGRAPAVAMKTLKQSGYPMSHVLGFVWASSEADIKAGGGFQMVQGYNTMQFAGVGDRLSGRSADHRDVQEGRQAATGRDAVERLL